MTTVTPISPLGARLGVPRRLGEQVWPQDTCPLVTILCPTYNHERFIAASLEGFLLQETTFPVEIIVQDDASTDGTAEIVRDYARRYPQIFRPVLLKTNQYSLGKKPTILAFGRARGQYIAICEGDDFWIDPRKLESQINVLSSWPECDLAFHPAYLLPDGVDQIDGVMASHANNCTTFSAEVLIAGGGGFCPTASLMLRRTVLENLPPWFFDAPVGDYFLQILGAMRGGAIFLEKPMAVHRTKVPGSWTTSTNSIENYLPYFIGMLKTLHSADIWTKGRYAHAFLSQTAILCDEASNKIFSLIASETRPPPRLSRRERLVRFAQRISRNGLLKVFVWSFGNILVAFGACFVDRGNQLRSIIDKPD